MEVQESKAIMEDFYIEDYKIALSKSNRIVKYFKRRKMLKKYEQIINSTPLTKREIKCFITMYNLFDAGKGKSIDKVCWIGNPNMNTLDYPWGITVGDSMHDLSGKKEKSGKSYIQFNYMYRMIVLTCYDSEDDTITVNITDAGTSSVHYSDVMERVKSIGFPDKSSNMYQLSRDLRRLMISFMKYYIKIPPIKYPYYPGS